LTDAWYPVAEDFYVSGATPEMYPIRQGDLMVRPDDVLDSKGKLWHACQVVHPSCEMVAKKDPKELQVVRVYPLATVSSRHQESILRGATTVDGQWRVAWAHTFFLPPVGELTEPMFSDLRQVARIPRDQLAVERRIAALTHDARVYFIRRKIYWEQRWRMDLEDVYGLESVRIGSDLAFIGDKPEWATAAGPA
jgi:hypothetical protein